MLSCMSSLCTHGWPAVQPCNALVPPHAGLHHVLLHQVLLPLPGQCLRDAGAGGSKHHNGEAGPEPASRLPLLQHAELRWPGRKRLSSSCRQPPGASRAVQISSPARLALLWPAMQDAPSPAPPPPSPPPSPPSPPPAAGFFGAATATIESPLKDPVSGIVWAPPTDIVPVGGWLLAREDGPCRAFSIA